MNKTLGFFLSLVLAGLPRFGESVALLDILRRMEDEVLAFSDFVESMILTERCKESTLANCLGKNHDTCLVEYPNQKCPVSLGPGTLLDTPECQGETSSADNCNGLFMFDHTALRIKEGVGFDDFGGVKPKAVESLCFSLLLEPNMIERYNNISDYWASTLKVPEVPYIYLGMSDSTFRIYPARQRSIESCNSYDPRLRPWYIAAASSGPKDVILILDNSGSTSQQGGGVSELLQTAAYAVLNSLSDNDRVGIVQMDDNPSLLLGANFSDLLIPATVQNRKALRRAIQEQLQPSGKANVLDAFKVAFDSLNRTIEQEFHSQCNVAILFFTDGGISDFESVVKLINSRKSSVKAATQRSPMIFLYAIATANFMTDTKDLACRTNSLWTKVLNADQIEQSVATYYNFFAFGRGQLESREANAVWVKPYKFATSDNYGTTVSSPVYDRSIDPPAFVGAVGIDISVASMEKALPGEARKVILDAIETLIRTRVICPPAAALTECQLESLRRETLDQPEEAVCEAVCANEADLVQLEPLPCAYHVSQGSYDLESLLVNSRNKGKSFEERVCCIEGETGPSDKCIVSTSVPSFSTAQASFEPSPTPSNMVSREVLANTYTPTNTPTRPTTIPEDNPQPSSSPTLFPLSRSLTLTPTRGSSATPNDNNDGNDDKLLLVIIVLVAIIVVFLLIGAVFVGYCCASRSQISSTPSVVTSRTPPSSASHQESTSAPQNVAPQNGGADGDAFEEEGFAKLASFQMRSHNSQASRDLTNKDATPNEGT